MLVFFDNYCKICRRTAFIISKLDWLNLINLKPLRDHLENSDHPHMDRKLALSQMASFTDRWQYGFASIFEITKRLPVFWIFVPFIWILKISNLGQFLYQQLSVKRKIIPIKCNDECMFNYDK